MFQMLDIKARSILKTSGICILLMLFIPFIFPFMNLELDHFVLNRLDDENYRLEEDSKTLFSSGFWFLTDAQSNYDFLFLLLISISSIFLSYKHNKISSFLWLCFASLFFTRWFSLNLGFRVASFATVMVNSLSGNYGIFTFTTSPSITSLIILFTVSLAIIVSILELLVPYIRKNDIIHKKNNDNGRTNYSLLIGGIIIIYLPIWFGPFFTNTSLIYVLYFYLGMNKILFNNLLAILSLLLCSLIWIVFAFLLLPINKIMENLTFGRENRIEIGITLITLIIITLKYFSVLNDPNRS